MDRSLTLRMRIFVLLALAAIGVVVTDLLVLGPAALLPVLASATGGALAGLVASRVLRLEWNIKTARVVGRIDAIGALVLVGYLVLMVFRSRLLSLWINAPMLGAAALAALSGLMVGQVLGTLTGIRRVLTHKRP